MNNENGQSALNDLESNIAASVYELPDPMPGDKWLVSSAMQKAIRRGEIERAVKAGATLWHSDRQNFWRRLHIISLEDVGPVSVDAVVKTLMATALPVCRKRIGDLRVGLHLIRLLCDAHKTRMADELFIQIEHAIEHAAMRDKLSVAQDDFLSECVLDEARSLIERAMALRCLAGSRKFPSETMRQRKGDPVRALEVVNTLNAPKPLLEGCAAVLYRTQWPLAAFTPLIWQTIKQQPRPLCSSVNPITAMDDVEGIPLYAADVFTRVGQSCMRELQKLVPEFKGFNVQQIGLALFYLEGQRLNKTVTCEFMEDFRSTAELADAEGRGLDAPSYLGLRECLAMHMDVFNDIRRKQLHRYLDGAA